MLPRQAESRVIIVVANSSGVVSWAFFYKVFTRKGRTMPYRLLQMATLQRPGGGIIWPSQFANIANGTHILRGVEVTVEGSLLTREGSTLAMQGDDTRPPLLLQPLQAADKIQEDAYPRLQEAVRKAGGSVNATVTGPLKKVGDDYLLEVRQYSVLQAKSGV
jgi:hypothetical protein